MKKLLTILIMTFGLMSQVVAQEEAVFTHYHINPSLINPASVGFESDFHRLFINLRNQWVSFPETPKTYALSYNGPVGKRLGIGAMVFTENIASLSTFRGQLSYAFNYELNDFKAAFGLSTEVHNMRLKNDVVNGELYDSGDALVSDLVEGVRVFDASIGIWGSYKKDTYFGFSVPNLVRNRLDEISGETSSFYFLATAGHKFHIPKYHFNFEPSFLIKKVRNVPFQLDVNAKAGFLKDKLITGLSVRTYFEDKSYPIIGGKGGALAILLGTTYKTLKIYYTYDVFFGQFQTYNGGSHEITVAFDFERKKEKKYDRSKKFRGKKKK